MFQRIAAHFDLKGSNTNLRQEVAGGTTTFLAMAYIIFVQPQVLSAAGMDAGAVMVATCLAAALGSLTMGILANYPIGVAPGMGENFFFAYTLVLAMGVSWQQALAIVFLSGILFILLTLFRIRELVINAVPVCLQHGIAVGIGLFIALIGLHDAGLVVASPGALVKLGDLADPPVLLALFGLAATAILLVRGYRAAILIGMLLTALAGIAMGIVKFGGVVSMPPSISPTFWQLDLAGVMHWKFVVPVIVFLYMALFDTIGTLIGVTSQAGILKDGKMPRASRALMADAIATTAGAAMGTSTTLAYIESITGVKVGARTGVAAIVTGLLFLTALFFSPLVAMIGAGLPLAGGGFAHPVTAPALILVGSLMMRGVRNIEWDRYNEAIPAFLTMVAIPFTYSIAEGIAVGFVAYPLLKLCSGKGRQVSALTYILGVLFLLKFLFIRG